MERFEVVVYPRIVNIRPVTLPKREFFGIPGAKSPVEDPVFVFGTKLNNGIHGENPGLGLDDLHNGNLKYNIDYRRIYTSVIQDWFEGDNQALIDTGFADWVDQKIPIVSTTGSPDVLSGNDPNTLQLYPNPVADLARVQFTLERRGKATLHVIDSSGRTVHTVQQEGIYGSNSASLEVSDLRPGVYQLLLLQNGNRFSTKFLKL